MPTARAPLAELPVELAERREAALRLRDDADLQDLDDAARFLDDRGLLTLTPCCALPSLFGACHGPDEDRYRPDRRGYAAWPQERWWWGGALSDRAGVHGSALHAGRILYLSDRLMAVARPLCEAELARAEAGDHGEDAARLVLHLDANGPALADDVKDQLGLAPKPLRALRVRLEKLGAVHASGVTVPAKAGDGHRHATELRRFDQRDRLPPAEPGGLTALITAAVGAAVAAPASEVRTWFSWRPDRSEMEDLVSSGALVEPSPGWVAAPGA